MDEIEKKVNHVLVRLINEIWKCEEKVLITEEFQDLTNTDMHVIEAVGLGSGDTMTPIAKRLNVTVGTLTTSMNRLVSKGYVIRTRSEADRRIVQVHLTERGIAAYHHHEDYHRRMTRGIIERLGPEQLPVLEDMLDALVHFFEENQNK